MSDFCSVILYFNISFKHYLLCLPSQQQQQSDCQLLSFRAEKDCLYLYNKYCHQQKWENSTHIKHVKVSIDF